MVFVIHWHKLAMDLHVFPIPIPTPTSLSTRSLWVFPVHQPQAPVSCIQPGLVICFTLDNIHVLMLIQNFKIQKVILFLCVYVQSFQLWWTVAIQAPLSMGILQARILEWVAMPSSRRSFQPRNWICISCFVSRFFTAEPLGKPSLILSVSTEYSVVSNYSKVVIISFWSFSFPKQLTKVIPEPKFISQSL